jgi:hypothetical protein
MSTFWIVYWVVAAIMGIGSSTIVWWSVKKEGEDFTLQALLISCAITFIPVLNVIALVVCLWHLIAHNINLVLFKGKKPP